MNSMTSDNHSDWTQFQPKRRSWSSLGSARLCVVMWLSAIAAWSQESRNLSSQSKQAEDILDRVRKHDFNPLRDGFTLDRHLNKQGVASLSDKDWLVRTLAVRDLVRLGVPATVALSSALKAAQTDDKSRDVQHQAELAAYAVEHGKTATPELAASYARVDETRFGRVQVGQPASDFELPDTEGKTWRLADFRGKKPVVLIWIFADWCPVCHGEFRELIELRRGFEAADVQVFTLECHDLFPCRVMVGKELDPKYWFSKTSFKESYTHKIWWPHLADRAGAVGAEYGVQPMAFVVHSEYINRPSVVIVDKEGMVRFAYYGTFWGDRPSVDQLLEMVRSDRYEFESERRLKVSAGQ